MHEPGGPVFSLPPLLLTPTYQPSGGHLIRTLATLHEHRKWLVIYVSCAGDVGGLRTYNKPSNGRVVPKD
jgi:hypothetical protein